MEYIFTAQETSDLISWYEQNKRSLPWRDTGNPYHTWISEIMLQQTRIDAVIDHFNRFIEELPDIPALAECDDDRLMKLWEGLGYYSRARNLKKCAVVLVQEYNSRLPADHTQLLKLPGIGPYTAGAVSSICFGLPEPAVDGNVLRIFARYSLYEEDIRDKKATEKASVLLKNTLIELSGINKSSFTQGIMELGQKICIPNGTPRCDCCPLSSSCKAHLQNRTDTIPYRSALKKRKIEKRTILIIRDGERFLLHKRPARGLLAGLYEFIGTENHVNRRSALEYAEKLGFTGIKIKSLPSSVHIFSHIEWHMNAYEIRCAQIDDLPDCSYILAEKKELASLAVPSAFRTYTDYYSLRD